MHERRRRTRSAIVMLLALAALAWSAAAPLTAFGAFAITLEPGRQRLRLPDPDHERTRRHEPAVRRRAARRSSRRSRPAVPSRRSWTSARRSRTAASAACSAWPSTRNFMTNDRLFVYYTRNGGDIVVSRFTTNAARTDVIESTARPLLLIEHSANTNHNGGAMAFGPNGYLYIGIGDGGGAGDPREQRTEQVEAPRQDPADQRQRHGPRAVRPLLGPARAIRSTAPRRVSTRSGPMGCATRGGSRSIAAPASCSSPMSARAAARRSTARRPASPVAGTTAGTRWRARSATRHRSARWRATRCPNAEYSHDGGNCSITGRLRLSRADPDRPRRPVRLRRLVQRPDLDHPVQRHCRERARDVAGRHGHHITSFGESENGELYVVTSAGDVYQVIAS